MKKFRILYFLPILLLSLMFCACGLFDNNDNTSNGNGGNSSGSSSSSSNNSTTYNIRVIYDDESLDFSYSSISNIKITPKYKNGYVLNGYYSDIGGRGELMFDYLGNRTSGNWSQSRTTLIYPHYTEINSSYVYTSTTLCNESPGTFHYNIHGATYAAYRLTYEQDNYIHKVCVSNPTVKIKLTAHADVRAEKKTTGVMNIAIGPSSDNNSLEGKMISTKSISLTADYAHFSQSVELSAQAIVNSKDKYLGIGFMTNGTIISYYKGYAKNLYYTMSIV